MLRKNEIVIVQQHFLNMDFSVRISHNPFKYSLYIHEIGMQGSMSQNIDLGPSFDL